MNVTNLLLLLLLFFIITVQSSPIPSLSLPHFAISLTQNSSIAIPPQEYFQVTLPLLTDDATPACSVNVLTDSFGNPSGSTSISLIYTPPPVICEWSHAVLHYQAEYKGDQYGSIAGVWIDGVELLRTSTPHPTEDGVLWNVRKDVTKYSSIFTRENLTLSVMLGNLGNDEFTGVYQVNVSFLFYSDKALVFSGESEAQTLNRKLISVNADKLELERVIESLYPYDTPADLIVPISGAPDEGYWFKIQDEFDVRNTNVQISPTTYKAVLELYVSFHGDDEFWYMNPPDSYIQANHLTTGGHGAYREVLVTIDGKLVGTVIPFPVIFPSGINPLFWSPVVSIGAFDVPSYDIDFTPYLGLLLDNKTNHSIGFQVADGLSFWLVDANLHLWSGDSNVVAIVEFEEPSKEIETEYDFEGLEGEFVTEVDRSSKGTGWVQSSTGLVKTKVKQEINLKNTLKFKDDGKTKQLEQEIKIKSKIKITNEKGESTAKIEIEKMYPLTITIESEPSLGKDTSQMTTTVVQGRSESFYNKKTKIPKVLNQNLNCTGTMLVKGNSVIGGSVENHQNYEYTDGLACYSRKVDVVDGDVVADERLLICGD